jgi:hypothetical protein
MKRSFLARAGTLVVVANVIFVGSGSPATAAPAALRPTKTTVACKPDTLIAGASTSCTVRVADTGTGKKSPPAGTASVATSAPGAFDSEACTLATSGAAAATCTVAYRAAAIGNGVHVISASYGGSDVHAVSNGRFELGVTPPNDNRRSASPLRGAPSSVQGTTVGATFDYSDPESGCNESESTVWYSLAARSSGRVAVRLRAHGRLDAVLAVFRRVRSHFERLGCVPTDERGIGGIAFEAGRGGRYLVLVGERDSSASSTFQLELFAPPLARPPGVRLPTGGARSSVDPLTRPEAAWSFATTAGTTYRINLAPARGRCLPLYLFGPGTSSFAKSRPIRARDCGGYFVFTPGPDQAGRYSLLVEAHGNRGGRQQYRLRVARAGRDDTAPGLPIADRQTRRGSLSGGSIDVLDLYRFHVDHRTEVTTRLRAPAKSRFELVLLSDAGGRIACLCARGRSSPLRARLDEGDYFVAVQARGTTAGRYAISLLIREITSTVALVEGVPDATAPLGHPIELSARLTPSAAVGGRVRFRVDRFDPIEGWQFSRIIGGRVASSGLAAVRWTPPTVGRWRVRAFFVGTTHAAPSASGHVSLLVSA